MKIFMGLCLLFVISINANPSKEKSTKCNDKKKIYKICEDQFKRFKVSEATAMSEGKLMLVKFGADWCVWCRSLHVLFEKESFKSKFKNISVFLVGSFHYDKMEKVADALKIFNAIKGKSTFKAKGIPYWGLYNPKNKKIHFQDTGALEKNTKKKKGHDDQKVFKAIAKGIELVRS